MFTLHEKSKHQMPIKIWLKDKKAIEASCLKQAENLSRLPFLHKWVALMPDTHTGMGMPIGGVIATKDVIIPNAVGKDIGCGVIYVSTNLETRVLRENQDALLKSIIDRILHEIPTGFGKRQEAYPSDVIKASLSLQSVKRHPKLLEKLKAATYQVGTLGGGNHFIELQEDDEKKLTVMIHSGSRHLGAAICDYFHHIAKEKNKEWYSSVPSDYHLAFLPTSTQEGKDYIEWMNIALTIASENRLTMMKIVKDIVSDTIMKARSIELQYDNLIHCHHNYASLESHYKEKVWVHRKGAIRAENGELGIIPGAMGSFSYIVMGKGNKESFHSASHGAGRRYSRKVAMKKFPLKEVLDDLSHQGVILGKLKVKDVPEEARFTYKDIDDVIDQETDLISPIKRLKTIGVVKG